MIWNQFLISVGFLISLLKKRWNFKKSWGKMHADKEEKNEQVPKLVNMGEETGSDLHLNCHFKFKPWDWSCSAEQRQIFMPVWDPGILSEILCRFKELFKEINGRKLQGKSSIEIAIFKQDSRQDYESRLTNLTNHNVLKMEIEI